LTDGDHGSRAVLVVEFGSIGDKLGPGLSEDVRIVGDLVAEGVRPSQKKYRQTRQRDWKLYHTRIGFAIL
jgi:hypothetical protein